jgi:hypothetical protein
MWKVDDIPGTSAISAGEMGQAKGDVPSTDQRAKRAYAIYTDQHGRVWGAVIENKTGDPCGPLEPQFSAPLRPDDKYITINSRMRRVHIRYADIIRDIAEANENWESQLRDYARKNYGTKAPEAIANPPADLLDLVGPRPRERREPWEAALTGNKYVLGLSTNKPDWAKEFFPEDAPKQRSTFQIDPAGIADKYPDAEEDQEPEEEFVGLTWAGRGGWKLPDGTLVPKLKDEEKSEHRARAEAMLAELEG